MIQAPSAKEARAEALAEIAKRDNGESRWSLGVLKPLTPKAPGTNLFDVTFAVWEATDDRFERHDVFQMAIWAEDASAARRIAQQDAQDLTEYDSAWRVRSVTRSPGRRRARR